MGIFCKINLHKPENGEFIGRIGTVVSGVIQYSVDEEMVFSKITVSLKGIGKLKMRDNEGSQHQTTYYAQEKYFDMDNVISEEKYCTVSAGSYEVPFKFVFDRNVPPTLAYKRYEPINDAKCNITYYVRIKFNAPGFLNFTKRFKKEITVSACTIPRLSTTPIIYGGHKKLSQIFTTKSRIIKVKANIMNSVLKPGDKITMIYDIINDTNLAITGVETKLVEVYKFYLKKTVVVKQESDIPESDSKIGAIQSEEKREILVEINVPPNYESAEFSKLFTKEFYVYITLYLPAPHRNYVLEVPVQISSKYIENTLEGACAVSEEEITEQPPSYWEAMNEYTDDKEMKEKK